MTATRPNWSTSMPVAGTSAARASATGLARLLLLLRVVILCGYPVVGVLLTFTQAESSVLTTPYRAAVFVLAGSIIWASYLSRRSGHVDGLIMAFFGVYLCRLLYDWYIPEVPGTDTDLLFFVVVTLVPNFASMMGSADPPNDATLAKCALPVAVAIMSMALIAYTLGLGYNPWADHGIETDRLGFQALNPISLGHVGGLGLLCVVYLYIETRRTTVGTALLVGAGFLSLLTMVVANSRGPMVAAVLALSVFFLSQVKRAVYVLPFVVIVPFFISLDNTLIKNVLDRFSGDAQADLSSNERLNVQAMAVESFWENPFFGAHHIDPTLGTGAYPHNLIIETAMALGILGLVLLFGLLFRAARNIVRYYNLQHPFVTMLLVQQFIAMQLSGAIWAADAFFMALGLCLTSRPPAPQHLAFRR